MKARLAQFAVISALVLAWAPGWWGCSGSKVAPLPPIPPTPPGYVQVPHPEGLDVGDLMAIFTDRGAPSPEELKVCDVEYMKLRTLTDSKEELVQGAREFIRTDPVRYHWCFYSKLMEMEEHLQKDTYLDERQNHVLQTYLFVSPFARAFLLEYHDSRYLRWAVARYRRVSEYVFYRRVELSPNATAELAESANPFGLERTPADERRGVLEKYGLVKGEPIPEPSGIPPPTAQLPMGPGGTGTLVDAVVNSPTVETLPTGALPSETNTFTPPPTADAFPAQEADKLAPPVPTVVQQKTEKKSGQKIEPKLEKKAETAKKQPVTTIENRVPAKENAIKAKGAPLKTPSAVAASAPKAVAKTTAPSAPANNSEGKGSEAVLDGDNLTTVGE